MSRRKVAGRNRGTRFGVAKGGAITPPPPPTGDHLLNTGGVDILTDPSGDQLTNG